MIRNIDKEAYRLLKTTASAEGRTIGDVVSDAIRLYVGRPIHIRRRKTGTIADLKVWDFGPGSEHWSDEIKGKGKGQP